MATVECLAYGPLRLLPDQFDALQMPDFYKMLDAYLENQKNNDRKAAYYATWMLIPFSGKDFDFVATYTGIYQGLHPDETKPPKEEKAEFMKQFNL